MKILNYFARKIKQQTPTYICKKNLRPQTKHACRKANNSRDTTSSVDDQDTAADDQHNKRPVKFFKKPTTKKIATYDLKSDTSTDEFSDDSGNDKNLYMKLCSVIDKLQDHQW